MTEIRFLAQVIGPVRSDAALFEAVERGVSSQTIDRLAALGWRSTDVNQLLLDKRKLRRRRQDGRLTSEESDRLVRLLRLQFAAERIFKDRSESWRWLRKNLRALGGRSPLEVARYEAGATVVARILASIEWGAPA